MFLTQLTYSVNCERYKEGSGDALTVLLICRCIAEANKEDCQESGKTFLIYELASLVCLQVVEMHVLYTDFSESLLNQTFTSSV